MKKVCLWLSLVIAGAALVGTAGAQDLQQKMAAQQAAAQNQQALRGHRLL